MPVRPTTIFVETREGPTPVTIPADVSGAITSSAGEEDSVERALRLAGLVLLRVGEEAGTLLLRHWIAHDPGLLLDADPVLATTLADAPELLVGPLAGTPLLTAA